MTRPGASPKKAPFVIICLALALLVSGVGATVYATDGSLSVSLKYTNGDPTLTESFLRVAGGNSLSGEMEALAPAADATESDLINVLTTVKDGEETKHNLQTAPTGAIFVSSTSSGIDVMQTSTEPGHAVLELYYSYDKSPIEPWRYYMRVNNLDDGYSVLSDFNTKEIWIKTVTKSQAQDIINSGQIPAWESIR